jgi:hypothetical protein
VILLRQAARRRKVGEQQRLYVFCILPLAEWFDGTEMSFQNYVGTGV